MNIGIDVRLGEPGTRVRSTVDVEPRLYEESVAGLGNGKWVLDLGKVDVVASGVDWLSLRRLIGGTLLPVERHGVTLGPHGITLKECHTDALIAELRNRVPTNPETPPTIIEIVRALQLDERATKGPWRWWTSNSLRRLSSDATGKDGDVAYARIASDGVPDIAIQEEDMAMAAESRTLLPKFARALVAPIPVYLTDEEANAVNLGPQTAVEEDYAKATESARGICMRLRRDVALYHNERLLGIVHYDETGASHICEP